MDRPNTSQGKPLDKEPIYDTLFTFINDVLFLFKPFSKDVHGNPVTAEDLITQDLEMILSNNEHNPSFAFQNQHKKGQYSTDICVYKTSSYKVFCWIEAKRLPTPDAGTKRDEREYVVVSDERVNGKKKFKGNGGIQRFKENNHAPNLPYSIMIGYLQEKDADYWLEKINDWIRQLIIEDSAFWSEDDCLCKNNIKKCDCYISVHSRKNDLSSIILFHFWIKL